MSKSGLLGIWFLLGIALLGVGIYIVNQNNIQLGQSTSQTSSSIIQEQPQRASGQDIASQKPPTTPNHDTTITTSLVPQPTQKEYK